MEQRNDQWTPIKLPSYNTAHHKRDGFCNVPGDPQPPEFRLMVNPIKLQLEKDVTQSLEVVNPIFPGNEGVRVWWIGHATTLIQIGIKYIITDPVFSSYASPIPGIVSRVTRTPCTIDDLPPIAVILISHCHWDHLDLSSIKAITAKNPACKVFVPLKVSSYLKKQPIVEFDWRTKLDVYDATFTCLPAWHGTARYGFDSNKSLWCSWLIEYENISIYFPGDTAIGPHFAEIRQLTNRDIDLFLAPIGPQNPVEMMRSIHLDGHEAKWAADVLGAKAVVPIHYGTFPLGLTVEHPDEVLIQESFVDESDRLFVIPVGGCVMWDGVKFVA